MSRLLPAALAGAPNALILVMDRSNIAHRPTVAGEQQKAACGMSGTPVTLAQAITYAVMFCGHAYCYQANPGGRPPRRRGPA